MLRQPLKVIIVGASSGIGKELALQMAQRGAKVAVVARRKAQLDELATKHPGSILPYAHDVKATAEVPELLQKIAQDLGGLDMLVYASGVMPPTPADHLDPALDFEMVDVNIKGAVAWIDEAANRFAQVKAGTIIGIGSVAGERGRYAQPVYNASKAFLATYLESLRNRLSNSGVTVVTIKPGPVDTEMTAHLKMKKMPAEVAATKILQLSSKNGEFYLSSAHRLVFFIIRNLPSPILRRLKI